MSGLRAAIAALCLYAASSTTPIPTTSPSTSPMPTPTTSTSPTLSPIASAADDDDDGTAFGLKLADKAAHSLEIAATIEGLYNAYQISGGSSCKGYSDCATALPAADCDAVGRRSHRSIGLARAPRAACAPRRGRRDPRRARATRRAVAMVVVVVVARRRGVVTQ